VLGVDRNKNCSIPTPISPEWGLFQSPLRREKLRNSPLKKSGVECKGEIDGEIFSPPPQCDMS
jgi:hypothetical protein